MRPTEPVAGGENLDESPADDETDDIPELIQDTLPDLDILSIRAAAAADSRQPEPAPVAVPELESRPEPESEPEPVREHTPPADAVAQPEPTAIESSGPDVADWDRDPTFAELKPDLEALEAAMATSVDNTPEPPVLQPEPLPEQAAVPPPTPEIPEITLDHAISQRIESNLIDEPGAVSPSGDSTPASASPDSRPPAGRGKKADVEIDKISSELARAKSLEDVDDAMAETLFGDELNFAAAELAAVAPATNGSANDALEPDTLDDPSDDSMTTTQGAVEAEAEVAGPEFEATVDEQAGVEVTLASDDEPRGGLDLSASQRLKTVRALNAEQHPEPADRGAATPPEAVDSDPPESIEDQIDTTMTQTLKALNITPPLSHDEDEEKRGFFSRFKRS